MNDYASLPNAAELCGELLAEAKRTAETINELRKENAKLKEEKNDILTVLTNDMVPRRMFDNVCAQRDELKAERDALIKEIGYRDCDNCKYDNMANEKCGVCDYNHSEWEWRGVTNDG